MSEQPNSRMENRSDKDAPDREERWRGDDARGYVSLLDVLIICAQQRKIILRSVLVFALLGGIYAYMIPDTYTSTAEVLRETESDVPEIGGLGASALRGFGINLSNAGGGLTAPAFPEILLGRGVRQAVVRDTFYFPDMNQRLTFTDYVNQPPGPVGRLLQAITSSEESDQKAEATDSTSASRPYSGTSDFRTSKAEGRAMNIVLDMVTTTIGSESGIMSISVTSNDPVISHALAVSFVRHLTDRVRELRTEKVRERLAFVEQRFEEVADELKEAEDQLAQFLQRNQNPTTAELRFQRDRLQRQVSFKEQLYSDLQNQRTQTRIELQRQQPVVTVVEEAVPPQFPSGPHRLIILIFSVITGLAFGFGGALLKHFLSAGSSSGERDKLGELWQMLRPDGLFSSGARS